MPLPTDIQTYHGQQNPADRQICAALAKSIDAHLLDIEGCERKVWHRHPVWFIDGNPIVGYSKLKDTVRLLFWSGQSFDEPNLLPEGSFKAAEARFTARSQVLALVRSNELTRWLEKAVAIQWDYKNIVKRKGKLLRLK